MILFISLHCPSQGCTGWNGCSGDIFSMNGEWRVFVWFYWFCFVWDLFYFMSCLSKNKICQHNDNPCSFPLFLVHEAKSLQNIAVENAFWYWQDKCKEFGVYFIGHLHQRSNFSCLHFVSLAEHCLRRSISYFQNCNVTDIFITQQFMVFLL